MGMNERVSNELVVMLRQGVAVSVSLTLGEQERVLLDLLDARREREEAMATLVSARESYDLVQKHAPAPVAEMVRGFFVTVRWDAARAAAKERADDGFSDEGTRSRNRNCDDWIAPRGSHGR
jgi:hypothetical protein